MTVINKASDFDADSDSWHGKLRGEIEVPFVPSLKKVHLEVGSISLPAELVNQLDQVLIRCGRPYEDVFSIESLSEQLFGPGSIRITFEWCNRHASCST